jgi:hypothetical protein
VSKKSWWRPEERFAALLEIQLKGCDEIAQRGCPYGSLAQELEKRDGRLGSRAALLVELQREWMERQFQAMGLNQRAPISPWSSCARPKEQRSSRKPWETRASCAGAFAISRPGPRGDTRPLIIRDSMEQKNLIWRSS